jgi:hypothetical protein
MMKTVKEFADYANESALYEFGKEILNCKEPKEALKDLFTYMHYGLTDNSEFLKELKEDQKEGYLKVWTWYKSPGQPQGFIPTVKGINQIYKYLVNPQSFTIEPFDYQIKEAQKQAESTPPTEVYKYRANDLVQMGKFIQRVLGMGYKSIGNEGHFGNSRVVLRKGNTQVEIYLPLSEAAQA